MPQYVPSTDEAKLSSNFHNNDKMLQDNSGHSAALLDGSGNDRLAELANRAGPSSDSFSNCSVQFSFKKAAHGQSDFSVLSLTGDPGLGLENLPSDANNSLNAVSSSPPPDIVMISADDLFNVMRFRSVFGVDISTPNIDRLAAQGVTFSNSYVTTAICNVSRTSILSGQNPYATGVHWNAQNWWEHVDPNSTLPALLKAAGYCTANFGKTFHDAGPVAGGLFDTFMDMKSSNDPDTATTNGAVDLLSTYAGAAPLLLMMGFVDPHAPFASPQQFRDLYPIENITFDPWAGDTPSPYVQSLLNTAATARMTADGSLATYIQGYLANISEMDAKLGQILDAIEGNGRNTAVIFYSDNGYSLGDHSQVGKFTLWEQAASVPLIIWHPQGGQGTVSNNVSLLDLAPTILQIAGVTVPPEMEGTSLLDQIMDPGAVVPDRPVVTTMWGSISVKFMDWRYTRYLDGSVELFDCANDSANADNLAGDAAFAVIESQMLAVLEGEMSAMNISYDDVLDVLTLDRGGGDNDYFFVDLVDIGDTGGIDIIYCDDPDIIMPVWAENFHAMQRSIGGTLTANDLDNKIWLSDSSHTVDAGGGNDTIVAWRGKDSLVGGLGDDWISGGLSNDSVEGGAGADTMFGAGGQDWLSYQTSDGAVTVNLGRATVAGGHGNGDQIAGFEHLSGSAFNDTLTGSGAANKLNGMAGDDRLFGGNGNDTIVGGDGQDWLYGGAGADRFVYAKISESVVASRDKIGSFDANSADKIDLSAINAADAGISSDLTFIGNGPITGLGQIRTYQLNGNTYIDINIDDSIAPEMSILLIGLITLDENDFVL